MMLQEGLHPSCMERVLETLHLLRIANPDDSLPEFPRDFTIVGRRGSGLTYIAKQLYHVLRGCGVQCFLLSGITLLADWLDNGEAIVRNRLLQMELELVGMDGALLHSLKIRHDGGVGLNARSPRLSGPASVVLIDDIHFLGSVAKECEADSLSRCLASTLHFATVYTRSVIVAFSHHEVDEGLPQALRSVFPSPFLPLSPPSLSPFQAISRRETVIHECLRQLCIPIDHSTGAQLVPWLAAATAGLEARDIANICHWGYLLTGRKDDWEPGKVQMKEGPFTLQAAKDSLSQLQVQAGAGIRVLPPMSGYSVVAGYDSHKKWLSSSLGPALSDFVTKDNFNGLSSQMPSNDSIYNNPNNIYGSMESGSSLKCARLGDQYLSGGEFAGTSDLCRDGVSSRIGLYPDSRIKSRSGCPSTKAFTTDTLSGASIIPRNNEYQFFEDPFCHRISGSEFNGIRVGGSKNATTNACSSGSLRRMLSTSRGALLYGPHGCGKTTLARALAAAHSASFLLIRASELVGKYLGETESNVRRVFSVAASLSPCVLCFQCVETLCLRRGGGTNGDADDRHASRALSQLLNEMDGVSSLCGVVVIGCTSQPWLLDDAATRPGRFGAWCYIGPPTKLDLVALLRAEGRATKVPFAKNVDLVQAASRLAGHSCASVCAVVKEAARDAVSHAIEEVLGSDWRRTLLSSNIGSSIDISPVIDLHHLMRAISKVDPSSQIHWVSVAKFDGFGEGKATL
eukprot:Rmarinus@m.29165